MLDCPAYGGEMQTPFLHNVLQTVAGKDDPCVGWVTLRAASACERKRHTKVCVGNATF